MSIWNESPFASVSAQTYLDGIEASSKPFEKLLTALTHSPSALSQSMAACESMYAAIGVVASYSGLSVVTDTPIDVHALSIDKKQWRRLQDYALASVTALGSPSVASYKEAANDFEDEEYLETMQSAKFALARVISPV